MGKGGQRYSQTFYQMSYGYVFRRGGVDEPFLKCFFFKLCSWGPWSASLFWNTLNALKQINYSLTFYQTTPKKQLDFSIDQNHVRNWFCMFTFFVSKCPNFGRGWNIRAHSQRPNFLRPYHPGGPPSFEQCLTWAFGWTTGDPSPPPNLGPVIR